MSLLLKKDQEDFKSIQEEAARGVFLCAEGIKAAHTACAAFFCMLLKSSWSFFNRRDNEV